MTSTQILIADDHNLFREGLREVLSKRPDFEVIGEASDGRALFELASEREPDVVIMDVIMPELNGIEATRKLKAAKPDTKVLALSMHNDRRFVTRMLHAGAAGYLLKDCASEELVEAIEVIDEGGVYLSPGVGSSVLLDCDIAPEGNARRSKKNVAGKALTPREKEVLQLVAEGCTTRAIADRLTLAVKTVESHRKQIMDKLERRSVAELTKYAVREGLTSLEN